jgi:hypothetical protein
MAKNRTTDILIEENYVDADDKYHSYKVYKRSNEETARMEKLVEQLGKSKKKHRSEDYRQKHYL